MRTIKFRAWDLKSKRITGVPVQAFLNWKEEYGLMLMQYTGLKDKNGVEIYEGDLLDIPDIGTLLVIWNPETAGFTTNPDDGNHMMGAETCEVIGNIYENPELVV